MKTIERMNGIFAVGIDMGTITDAQLFESRRRRCL